MEKWWVGRYFWLAHRLWNEQTNNISPAKWNYTINGVFSLSLSLWMHEQLTGNGNAFEVFFVFSDGVQYREKAKLINYVNKNFKLYLFQMEWQA